MPIDPVRDLEPVSLTFRSPHVLVVRNGPAARTVQDLVALARSQARWSGRAGDWAGWGLGGLALRLPGIAENGAQVPLTVTAKGALSAGRHVKAIHHFATRNPTPGIASYSFSPAS
ncbi:MAG: hypothetical protein IT557_19235 [Alphaproteobacteria bacterium]|nr:hypothetical protein [Alphaproteobacteria bacterium]